MIAQQNHRNQVFISLFAALVFLACFVMLFYSPQIDLSNNLIELLSRFSGEDNNDPLNRYIQMHEEIIDGKIKPPKVVFSGDIRPGYANKIYTVLTAMTAAVLTDSALVIEWKNIDTYIESPLRNTFQKFPSDSVFSSAFRPSEIINLPSSSKSSWLGEKKLNFYNSSYQLSKSATRFRFQSNTAFFFDLCTNPVYFDKILAYNLSIYETVLKANQSLASNSSSNEAERIDSLLKVGFEVASRLMNKLWKPKYFIQKTVNSYVNNRFYGHIMIGIHLRYQYLSDADVMTFAKCALDLEKHYENKSVKWFVSSDSWKVLTMLEKHYKEKVIFGEGKIGHTTHFPDTYDRAILDNELLSRCDELIVTGGSSYGFVASIRAARLPYFIQGRRNMTRCERMRLSRPATNQHGTALF